MKAAKTVPMQKQEIVLNCKSLMKLPITENVLKFKKNLNDPHHRFLSWEHCYLYYLQEDIDANLACLHLSFYLASWGMYRGSSFLLWKDYLFNKKIVEHIILLRKDLQSIDVLKASDQHLKKIIDLYTWIENWYKENTGLINGEEKKINPTQTLITKIILGTIGCIPAFDQYFIAGLKEEGIESKKVSLDSLKLLIDFYIEHKDQFEELEKKIRVGNLPYPPMKLVDMYFWQIGYDKDKSKK
jgi:hypothetical protein